MNTVYDQTVHTLLYGQKKFVEIADRIKAVDADGMDLSIESEGVNCPKTLLNTKIKQICLNKGLEIASSTPLYTSPGMDFCHTDQKYWMDTIEFSKQSVDVTVHAGCDRMLIVPGIVSVNHRYYTSREEDWKRAAECIREVGEYAAKQGVMLMIEPINRYRVALVHTIEQALQMINDIDLPNIHIVADTFHMQMEEVEGIVNALHRGGHHIKCLHIGDNTRRAPGYGVMNWMSIIAALNQIGFTGPLAYETLFTGYDRKRMCSDIEYMHSIERQLIFGVKHLRQIMLSVNGTKT